MKNLFLFLSLLLVGFASAQQRNTPVSLIFDSDIGPDYDDVGAMALMHALADSGQVNILATIACNQSKHIAGVMSVINTYFKRPNIPVGIVGGNRAVNMTAWQKWDSVLVAKYPSAIKHNSQAQNALALYRKILAKQPDGSVTICTVGFLSNLNDLLKSAPDEYSRLNGLELVKKKVQKVVLMAGRFPSGAEYNIQCDPISAKYVIENWPTEMIFSGWEIGSAIKTGLPLIQNVAIQNSPIKEAFGIAIPQAKEDAGGRMSWDQTAVLVAIKGYEKYFTVAEGRFTLREWGSNDWNSKGKNHFYLVQKMPIPAIENALNQLMMHQPK